MSFASDEALNDALENGITDDDGNHFTYNKEKGRFECVVKEDSDTEEKGVYIMVAYF